MDFVLNPLLTNTATNQSTGLILLVCSIRGPSGPSYVSCLRLLAAVCGTPAQPDLAGCVLFLRCCERGYIVDRCLQQCALAGALTGIAAIVAGNFHCTPVHSTSPVCKGPHPLGPATQYPNSHGTPCEADPLSLCFGWTSQLTVSQSGWNLQHTYT